MLRLHRKSHLRHRIRTRLHTSSDCLVPAKHCKNGLLKTKTFQSTYQLLVIVVDGVVCDFSRYRNRFALFFIGRGVACRGSFVFWLLFTSTCKPPLVWWIRKKIMCETIFIVRLDGFSSLNQKLRSLEKFIQFGYKKKLQEHSMNLEFTLSPPFLCILGVFSLHELLIPLKIMPVPFSFCPLPLLFASLDVSSEVSPLSSDVRLSLSRPRGREPWNTHDDCLQSGIFSFDSIEIITVKYVFHG